MMPSSISIPGTPSAATRKYASTASSNTGSSAVSSYSTSPRTTEAGSPASSPSDAKAGRRHERRRPSLLSHALAKQEATVIHLGEPDGTTRLISYLAYGQGFMWNPEIFLPSYVNADYVPLEHRRDPVHEITLSDEELKSMLPQ